MCWNGEKGDELTLVAACRDALQMTSAEEEAKLEEEFKPVID